MGSETNIGGQKKKNGTQNKEVISKNLDRNKYELNLPENMDNKEMINYLSSELLLVNKQLNEFQIKKQSIVGLLEEKLKIQRKQEAEQLEIQEKNQKKLYLSAVQNKQSLSEIRQSQNQFQQQQQKTNIFEASQNPYNNNINESNYNATKTNLNISQIGISKSTIVPDNKNDDLDSRLKNMNFHTDLKGSDLLESTLQNQTLKNSYINHPETNSNGSSQQNNKFSQQFNSSNISNNVSYNPRNIKENNNNNVEPNLGQELEEDQEMREQDKKQQTELAMKNYFNVPDVISKDLKRIDDLNDDRIDQLAEWFGLKTGKSHRKSSKQSLKDINWFLSRNKMPQTYLQNFSKEIEPEIEIPQESLVTQFRYKH